MYLSTLPDPLVRFLLSVSCIISFSMYSYLGLLYVTFGLYILCSFNYLSYGDADHEFNQ